MAADVILANAKMVKIMRSFLLFQNLNNLKEFHDKLEKLNEIKSIEKKCGIKEMLLTYIINY